MNITLDISKHTHEAHCDSHHKAECNCSVEEINTPMIAETVCDHTYQYYGHDHKNDYEKCTKCNHMREVE